MFLKEAIFLFSGVLLLIAAYLVGVREKISLLRTTIIIGV